MSSRLLNTAFKIRICPKAFIINKRFNSNRTPLMLMDLPRDVFPNLFQIIGIGLRMKFTMKKLDPLFKYTEFTKGSQQAMILISSLIARGEFDSLRNLVMESSIDTIKKNYALLSAEQKSMIATNQDDIQMQTLHLFDTVSPDDAEKSGVTYVKIGMLFQIVPGIREVFDEARKKPNAHMEIIRKFQQDLIVADYQFVREYRADKTYSDWIVSELNHWTVADYLEEYKNK